MRVQTRPDRRWVTAALWLALTACAPPAPPTTPPVPQPEGDPLTPTEIDALLEGDYTRLSGTWHSEFGVVLLTFADERHFSGIYTDGEFRGHVDVERGALVFDWSDDASVGRGIWTIIDEETLRGSWGVDASSTNGGDWTLER